MAWWGRFTRHKPLDFPAGGGDEGLRHHSWYDEIALSGEK